MIILEGVDSTGKSTLSKYLAKELNAHYMHASGHKSLYPSMFEHHKNLLDNAEVNLDNGHDVVIDRHWPSELCYGSVLRPELVDKYDYLAMIERLRSLNAVYIYCHSESVIAAYDRYKETHKDHDETMFRQLSREHYIAIAGEYRGIFQNGGEKQLNSPINYTIEEYGMRLEKIVEAIHEHN